MLNVPAVTLPTDDNVKVIKKLASCFKRKINWNKYQSIMKNAGAKHIFRFFNWSKSSRHIYTFCFIKWEWLIKFQEILSSNRKKKYYNVMIDGRHFFDQPVKRDIRTYDNMPKIASFQGDDYTIWCFLDYPYFESYNKLIAIGFSK